jgi:hypothetical protein
MHCVHLALYKYPIIKTSLRDKSTSLKNSTFFLHSNDSSTYASSVNKKTSEVFAFMNAKDLTGGQELICMNVDKVYDWIVNEADFDLALAATDITVPEGTTCADVATLSCSVTPVDDEPVVVISREDRQYMIDGATIVLQQVTLSKTFEVVLTATLENGMSFSSEPEEFTRSEQVVLCAPEGTEVEVTFTDLDCFITIEGTCDDGVDGTLTYTGTTVTVILCQSIQSTFPVTVEFLAEFCSPRDILPFQCPAPIRPLQCPAVFPSFGNGNGGNDN